MKNNCHNPYFNRWFSAIKKCIKISNELVVTILILIDGFLQYLKKKMQDAVFNTVTILILIDGFLQYNKRRIMSGFEESHNPYFNRWFSAIKVI